VAAQQEMLDDDGPFQYLPMLLKEDPLWRSPERVGSVTSALRSVGAVAHKLSVEALSAIVDSLV
jgi:hypothetical protein